jgi:D-3-phosphoglycerate dehydrogenase
VLTQSTLKVICRVGTGTDNVDYDAAKRHGIDVFNTPDAPTEAVAELTVGGILAVLRHIHVMHAAVRSGCWQKTMGGLLQGRTIGIVGLGRIGRRVAELLEPYHVILLAADPYPDKSWASSHRVEVLSLPELLSVSDIVTLHAAAPKTITPLIGSDEFALMKRGSVLINTARGSLVDEDALCAALTSGVLSAAYLDVFRTEPYCGRLAELPNVLLTAHAGTYTRETRQEMEMEAVRLLLKWFDRHSMARVV